jgi:hypothetical protein
VVRGPLTPHENFLYLSAKIEEALSRGTTEWPPESREAAFRRVIHILGAVTAQDELPVSDKTQLAPSTQPPSTAHAPLDSRHSNCSTADS